MKQTFEAIYSEHRPRVYRVCLSLVRNEALADDLTQDTFIHVHAHLKEFRGDSKITTWLHSIATRTCLMYFRAQKRRGPHVSLDDNWDGANGDRTQLQDRILELGYTDARLAGAIDRMTIEKAVRELPPQCRKIFYLFDCQGYGHNEIAQILGVSDNGTKSQLNRARRKLRAALEKAGCR